MDNNILEIPTELMQLISPAQAWYYKILPKVNHSDYIEFYYSKQNHLQIGSELEVIFGKKVQLALVDDEQIKKSLSKYYLRNYNSRSNVAESRESGKTDARSNTFISEVIEEALSLNCSDIHIEAYEKEGRIRFRMDGRLFERYILNKEDYPSIINQIKILSNLDIAEKRLPQDGRLLYNQKDRGVDLRISVLPSIYGEKIVLRLLKKTSSQINISELGLKKEQLEDYKTGIYKPHGLILISGPTGSGKTTTLYSTLKILNRRDNNILTIEDPVEYTIDGINQVQLREDIGLTFAKALKTFMRQDPDIIMLGEIRDPDTAQMAIRSALTGHLVLSTIHTNSAWGIATRLLDMGIPPFLLSSTLNTVVAQRLVRRLCKYCQRKDSSDIEKVKSGYMRGLIKKEMILTGDGCDKCFNSGYSGRIAVYEVINIDDELRESIKCSKTEITDYLSRKQVKTLQQSAIDLVNDGITSLEEVLPILDGGK